MLSDLSRTLRLAVAAASLSCVLSLAACSHQPAPRPSTGVVAGQVTAGGGPVGNPSGPVAGASVSFSAGPDEHLVAKTTADQSGRYSVTLAPGTYVVAFTPCVQERLSTTVTAGATTNLNLLCSMR